ncbi:MAG: RIP metalloprotease RseP [Thermodesulfobacteriota bacterium]
MEYIISFVIVLGVLIFFHELGHFLAARLFGVGVEKFSLGFGPRVLGKTVGGTDYRLSAIPLGGYVKMVGEEPDAEIDPADIPRSFTHKHVLQRICIVAAGPFFNILLAVLIYFGFFQLYGLQVRQAVVGEVKPDTPAARAGLESDDRIFAVNGVTIQSWEEMAGMIQDCGGQALELSIRRDGITLSKIVTPVVRPDTNLFGEKVDRYVIGIADAGVVSTRRLNPIQAFSESITHTYRVAELTVIGVFKLLGGRISAENLGGPLMIAQMAGDQAREGVENFIYLIAFISINLAIVNFLPIPVLDGGHLLFFFIEALRGRPVSLRIREVAQQGGMFVLLLLMIFVMYNDIRRYFDPIVRFFTGNAAG